MKSNVNIISNVYIRSSKSLKIGRFDLGTDPDFVAQIIDEKALKKIRERYPENSSRVKLSDIQNEILRNSITCSYGLPGEQTHGIVQTGNDNKWLCRCENYTCFDIGKCRPLKVERVISAKEPEDTAETDKLEWLGIGLDDIYDHEDDVPEVDDNSSEEAADTVDVNPKSGLVYLSSGEAENKIIRSDIQSRILVNAGPGTGKTYTAIHRLLYLLSSEEIKSADGILVLCYTRAAVEEIKERIENEIKCGNLAASARNIAIGTLDSFASTYLYLREINLSGMGYNARIEEFNKKFDSEDFEEFDYCIIDEIQDIVNDRALMALNILRSLKCGYLLLGDKCQAIYDYDNNSKTNIKSSEFYGKLSEILPEDTKYYELIDNMRQSEYLTGNTSKLRSALLNSDNDIEKTFNEVLTNLPAEILNKKDLRFLDKPGKTAILCRRNSQAEYISAWLHKNSIPHRLVRGKNSHTLISRYVSDILWDFSDSVMSEDIFIERAMVRCGLDEELSRGIFDALKDAAGESEDSNYFVREKLAKNLCSMTDIPRIISVDENNGLFVSTIHKSKGREFDNIFLYHSKYNHTEGKNEEERVYYVALTRAKTNITLLKCNVPQMSASLSGHCVTLNIYGKRADSITTGFYDDVNYFSCVYGDIERAVEMQEYISRNVRTNDKVTLLLNPQNRYDIMHNNNKIGEMSSKYNAALCETYGKNKRQFIYNKLPPKITDIYINNIFTFVSFIDDEKVPQLFRQNRFWLGIELSGFGNFKWEKS